jgi:hypothetical protein
MRTGMVPGAWFRLRPGWSTERMLDLLAEVDRRGIRHDDLAAVKVVLELQEAVQVLAGLLRWADYMGGWDGFHWRRAQRLVDRRQ